MVAGGQRHHLDIGMNEHPHAQGDSAEAHGQRQRRTAETERLRTGIDRVDGAEEPLLHPADEVLTGGLGFADEVGFQDGHDGNGIDDGHHQRNGDDPGEQLDEVAQIARDDVLRRIEHQADGQRSGEGGHKEFLGAGTGRVGAPKPLSQLVHVAVHRDDGIIDNHSQHDDERRQRHRVELHAREVHDGYGDGGDDGQAGAGDEGRLQGEQQQHDGYDHQHGDEQVGEERIDRVLNHLRLVADAAQDNARRQLGREFVQQALDVAS